MLSHFANHEIGEHNDVVKHYAEHGSVRKDADGNVKMNNYGRSRLNNEKSKIIYK